MHQNCLQKLFSIQESKAKKKNLNNHNNQILDKIKNIKPPTSSVGKTPYQNN